MATASQYEIWLGVHNLSIYGQQLTLAERSRRLLAFSPSSSHNQLVTLLFENAPRTTVLRGQFLHTLWVIKGFHISTFTSLVPLLCPAAAVCLGLENVRSMSEHFLSLCQSKPLVNEGVGWFGQSGCKWAWIWSGFGSNIQPTKLQQLLLRQPCWIPSSNL